MIITLLGYMGCGKSTAGKKLANLLNYSFIDLDAFIETNEQKSISQIFDDVGEDGFRKIEQKALINCLKADNTVISLGGGTPIYKNNMELINQVSNSIYLEMNAKALANRLEGEQDERPLIKGLNKTDLVDFIETNLVKRNPFYKQAKHTIPGLNLKVAELVALIKK